MNENWKPDPIRRAATENHTVLYTDGHGWSAWTVTKGATSPGAPVHDSTARAAWKMIGSPERVLFSTGTVERESLTIEQVEEWVKAQQPWSPSPTAFNVDPRE
jgi:hypothetical protein